MEKGRPHYESSDYLFRRYVAPQGTGGLELPALPRRHEESWGEVTVASFPEYDQFDGLGLAELIKTGQVSAPEVCEEAIRRPARKGATVV